MFNYQRKQIFRVNPSLADLFHNSLREIMKNSGSWLENSSINGEMMLINYVYICIYIYTSWMYHNISQLFIIHLPKLKKKKTRFWHSYIMLYHAISQSQKPIKSQVGSVRSGLLSGFSCNNSNNSSIAASVRVVARRTTVMEVFTRQGSWYAASSLVVTQP